MVNLLNPTSDGISIFAIIPDPGLGQNSAPDFGITLMTLIFVNNTKFSWPVTDPDGDSLVFSLVPPLDDGTNPNNGNSAPGGGAYPFYPLVHMHLAIINLMLLSHRKCL